MSEKRKRHLRVIDGGKSESYKNRISKDECAGKEDPKLTRLDQWQERMALLFARQRT